MKNLFAIAFSLLFINNVFGQTPDLVLPVGHTYWPEHIKFSPDSKLIATNSGGKEDFTLYIWEASSGKLLHTYVAFNFKPRDMRFLKDGKRFFLHDDFMSVIDLKTGNREIYFDTLPAEKIAISADEKLLAFQPKMGNNYLDSVCIYSMESGQLVKMFYSDGFEIENFAFSPDAKTLATFISYPYSVRKEENDKDTSIILLWDVATGKKILNKRVKQEPFAILEFSSDGKYLYDKDNKHLYNAQNGDELFAELNDGKLAGFATNRNLVVIDGDIYCSLTAIEGGETVLNVPKKNLFNKITFSSNEELLLIEPYESSDSIEVWNTISGKKMGALFNNAAGEDVEQVIESPDGKTIAIPEENGAVSLRSKNNFKEYTKLRGHTNNIVDITVSKDSSKLFVRDEKNHVRITDARTGKVMQSFQLFAKGTVAKCWLTGDEKKMLAINYDTTLVVWDVVNSKKLYEIKGDEYNFYNAAIHPSDKFFVTWEAIGDKLKFFDIATGKVKSTHIIKSPGGDFSNLFFSRDGKYLFADVANTIQVRDAYTGKLIKSFSGGKDEIDVFTLSNDGKKIAAGVDSIGYVWDIATGKRISTFKTKWPEYVKYDYSPDINFLRFNGDGKKILTGCYLSATGLVYDVPTGNMLHMLDSFSSSPMGGGHFLDDENIVVTREWASYLFFWSLKDGSLIKKVGTEGEGGLSAAAMSGSKLYMAYGSRLFVFNDWKSKSIYQSIFINDKDWLVADSASRYDGTEAARKLLYFVCDNEPIDLEQVKDQLWVPGLAERLYNGEKINAKGINELNICGLTPLIEDATKDKATYQFNITPRNGGLGDVLVQVNGIEVKGYNASQLKKENNQYQLSIPAAELKEYFIPGQENRITTKALTADNKISSRGFGIDEEDSTAATAPNLYAVMVGVSDYKGDEMDLKYAAKDANDIMAALGNASRKLLNTDGKEHVFTYNFTTDKQRYQLPEKAAIKKVMEEIGAKAQPNDILMLFFAGHGVMAGSENNKQFYFLTAEASALTAIENITATGISTAELTEWMKPQNIKAQKRILVFDACNSGQAIKDFVKIGSNDQNYLAARDDAKAQQLKAIDKLNEKSGLFILSASASNQSAYEMGRYSQGLLTYSLLKAIKQQPEILNNGKYLDLSKWFNAAKESVVELSKESGARQEPQIVTNTNFNVGIVDDEVIAKVVLPSEKPLFAASNFQNSDENIADDDLELNRLINLQLSDMAARGSDSKIIYVTATNSPDAYSLSGRYKVTGKAVTVSVNVKQGKLIKQKLEVVGNADKLETLAVEVVNKATGMIK